MIVKNVTMLGHKDHGKSTLIGSILMLTNSVSSARINEAKKYSKKLNKPFEPAFILDSFEEERAGGLTIDTTRAQASYKDLAFELIDVPGHEELIKNMMSGASYAETAILLVSAKHDEGIKEQTKRHIFVAKMLGIDSLVVAVNKMDLVNYSREYYEKIVDEIRLFLEKINFGDESSVKFVPISAYKGENIIKKSEKMSWYKGKPLLEELYQLAKKKREEKMKDLRAVVQGYIEEGRKNIISAKVLSGELRKGSMSLFPGGIRRSATKLIINGRSSSKAGAGSTVAIELDKPVEEARGLVIAAKSEPITTQRINSLIFSINRLDSKAKPTIKLLGRDIKAKKIKIKQEIDASNGISEKKSVVEPLNAGIVEINLESEVAVEKYHTLKSMGRFTFYINNKFSGIGIII